MRKRGRTVQPVVPAFQLWTLIARWPCARLIEINVPRSGAHIFLSLEELALRVRVAHGKAAAMLAKREKGNASNLRSEDHRHH